MGVAYILDYFLGGKCLDAQRMNVGLHGITQRIINHAVACDEILATERVAYDVYGEVASAALCADVSTV
jgi:hypothetical protein